MSWQLSLLRTYARLVEKPALARASPARARARFERQTRFLPAPPFLLELPCAPGGVPALWIEARPCRPQVLLWCHGGAHLMGSSRSHRALLGHICARTGLGACLPDYRRAPEHPFPASFEDMLAAWHGLRAQGRAAGQILLGGDSSGGGVALALLAHLLALGERPGLALALAPFTDLTGSGASFHKNAASDPLLPAARLQEVVTLFLAGADPADPRASPLFASFPDCPPVFLQASDDEILRDDSLRMATHLRREGAEEVEMDLWTGCLHVWPMFCGLVPEADAALARLARFVDRHLPPAG